MNPDAKPSPVEISKRLKSEEELSPVNTSLRNSRTLVTSMGQRSTLDTQQMVALQSLQDLSNRHHDHRIFPGNIVDNANLSTNPNVQPVLSDSGNAADPALQFKGYHHRFIYCGDHYNSGQNFHPIHNPGPIAPAITNFSNPCMVPLSSSRIFSIPWNNGFTDHLQPSINQRDIRTMGEFDANNHSINTRVPGKRESLEVAPGNHFSINAMACSILPSLFFPSHPGLPQLEQSIALEPNLVDVTNFATTEHQHRGTEQITEGSNRSVRRRSSVIDLQPATIFSPDNYLLQGIYMDQSLHSDSKSNMWTAQFGIGNNIGNGTSPTWNYTIPATYMHGRCVGSRPSEMINMDAHTNNGASSSSNAAIFFHPASMTNFIQHLPPVQTMQVQSYGHFAQIQARRYQNSPNNLYPVNINPLSIASDSGPRLFQFPSNAEQIYRHWQLRPGAPEVTYGNRRLLSSQDASVMEISGLYGVGKGNVIDHHQDMRMDIDEMSYEELLALEEQIGDVKTGLTEEYIRKNLKTTVHNLQIKSLPAEQSQAAESCTICQVEYEQDGITGTLDCGHQYHWLCIKQWLLLKNLCPICKSTALTTPENER